MVAENRESIEIDYEDLASEGGEQNICYFLPEAPVQVYYITEYRWKVRYAHYCFSLNFVSQVLGYLDRAVTEVTLSLFPFFPRIAPEVKVLYSYWFYKYVINFVKLR